MRTKNSEIVNVSEAMGKWVENLIVWYSKDLSSEEYSESVT